MRKTLNKIIAGAVALCMAASMSAVSAFAAGPYTDGTYTAKVAFLHESKEQNSMCNALFDSDADVVVHGETADVSVYAAFPVPAFPTQGADGTVKDVVMHLDGVEYPAALDIETKPEREFDETNPLFGSTAGQKLPTQVLTFTIPTAKVDMLADGIKTTAFVNVVMNSEQTFRLKLTNLVKTSEEPTEPAAPAETSTHDMWVYADIAAPAPDYMVTIPADIQLGTLSTEEDTVYTYTVDVKAENLGDGYVEVSTLSQGSLNNGQDGILFDSTFGTQKTSTSTSMEGTFTVHAEDVSAAPAGNYEAVVRYNIAYYAAK